MAGNVKPIYTLVEPIYTLSIDPGTRNIGTACFINKQLIRTAHVSLSNLPNSSSDSLSLMSLFFGLKNLLTNCLPYIGEIDFIQLKKLRVILEYQDIRVTRDFNGILTGILLSFNPTAQIFVVYPQAVSKWMGFQTIGRSVKKRKTLEWIKKKVGLEEAITHDQADAILNFIYADCRLFSNPQTLKSVQVDDATYRYPNHTTDTVCEDEHRPDWDQECSSDSVPS